MRHLSFSRCLLFLTALVSVSEGIGLAQDVTIRLINVKDGRPLQGQLIVLSLGNATVASTPEVQATTSSDGTAVFHLPEPGPEQVFLDTENGKIRACYSWGAFSTREIIEHGVVAENKCDPKGKVKVKFTAKPGEVIVFVRFLRWWERMQT